MPKKFQGENTKSAAARARKAEAKAAADAKRQQELEDAYWKDEDKHVMRKEQRKVNAWAAAPGSSSRALAKPPSASPVPRWSCLQALPSLGLGWKSRS